MILTFFFKENVQMKIRLVALEEKYHILMILENISDKIKLGEASAKWNYSYMLIKSLSHELFTPLHQILAISNRLFDMFKLKPQTISSSKVIHEEMLTIKQIAMCLHMTVKNMLDYANMINHTFELKMSRFHVRGVLEYVVTMFSTRAKKQKIELKFECDKAIEIFSDKERLAGLIFIFFENSIKFTSKGGILVSAQKVGHRVVFKVVDSGTGIESSDLKIIKNILSNPFLEDKTQNSVGLGIGFRIAQHLYKRLSNSVVEINSEKGFGTTIQFEIPLNLDRGFSRISSTISNKSRTNEFIFNAGLDLETDRQDEFRRERAVAFGNLQKAMLKVGKFHTKGRSKSGDVYIEKERPKNELGCIEEEKTYQLRQLSSAQEEAPDYLSIRQLDSMDRSAEDYFDYNKPLIESPWVDMEDDYDKNQDLMDSYNSPSPYGDNMDSLEGNENSKWALIVDDDAFNNDIAKNMLLSLGMRVYTAEGGDSAIELCESLLLKVPVRKIDLVLMDYYMPDKTGPQTTKILREPRFYPILQNTPIVGLTANSDQETKASCLKAGMNAVETKPCDLEKIAEILKTFKIFP